MGDRAVVTWEAMGRSVVFERRPRIMGIVNATPDSFSDGGLALLADSAATRAVCLRDEGADLIDVGGESSRPGAEAVSLIEELRRVIPAIEAISASVSLPISIDTSKAEVARLALKAGASIVNDITALTGDPEMVRVVADSSAGVVLMHMKGDPRTMQIDPRYDDVLVEVYDYLASRIDWSESLGIPRSRIAVDPGIGFGKTYEHNLALLRGVDRLTRLGCAVLIGTSRKGFMKSLTGRAVSDRMVGSVVSSLAAATLGASILRVHDVAAMADAIKVWDAIREWDMP